MSLRATNWYSVSLMSVDLPEPDTPVTHVITPSGMSTVTLRRLLPRALRMRRTRSSWRGVRIGGIAIARLPERYWPVIESGARGDVGGRALRDHAAAVHAGAGADIDDVVGVANRIFVVLDDDHRVAEIAQAIQRAQQPLVVALVQADRGLVEDVHDADQAGADLAREADALRFAAGERVGAAIERQVVEADVAEEPQALADLLDDLGGDLAAPACQFAARR